MMSDDAQLTALRALAAELPFASSEQVVVDRVLTVLEQLLPARALAIRVIDLRNREPARAYVRGAPLRDGVTNDPVTVGEAQIKAARLKSAVAASGFHMGRAVCSIDMAVSSLCRRAGGVTSVRGLKGSNRHAAERTQRVDSATPALHFP